MIPENQVGIPVNDIEAAINAIEDKSFVILKGMITACMDGNVKDAMVFKKVYTDCEEVVKFLNNL
jgi:hypothetical protein